MVLCGSRRRPSAVKSHVITLLLCVIAIGPAPTLAEIRTFNGPIAASSNYVHYSEGFIVAPGHVDLSQLIFAVSDDGGSGYAPAPRGRDDDDETQPAVEPTAESATTPPTAAPVQAEPAPSSEAPTISPVSAAPTAAPVKASAAPTSAPLSVAPTAAPVSEVPTAAPVQATAAPVKVTPAPITDAPSPAPVAAQTATTEAPVPAEAPKEEEQPKQEEQPKEEEQPGQEEQPKEEEKPEQEGQPKEEGESKEENPEQEETPKEEESPTEAAPPPTEAPPTTEAPVAPPPPTQSPVTPAPTEAPVAAPQTEAPVAAPEDDKGDDGGDDDGSDGGGGRFLAAGRDAQYEGSSNAVQVSRPRIMEESAVELEEEVEGDDDIPPNTGSSVVDIVFFLQPAECSQSQKGCDWTKLGVGASDEGGNLRWCCTDDAAELGFCDYSRQAGRLIIDRVTFAGEHRFVTIPPDGDFSGHVQGGDQFNVKDISGKYVMVIANCNDMGRDVNVSGTYSWVSKHGYLPGELFGEMYFFAAITVIYFLIFVWYACAMRCNRESTIGIQRWILWTILLGLLETFFNAGNFFVWNEDGVRVWYAMYTGVVLGVMKRAISRCLVVMVSLGWGVVRDTLGDQLKKIVFLGVLYVGVSAACECMKIFAVDQYKTLSVNQEDELFDIVTILTFVVAAVDVTFYMWILDALNGTMQYLENMSQSIKLRQYLRLRCILLFSILFAVVWAIFGIVNSYMDGMLEEQQQWSIQAAWELNYLMVLIGVACLWRPNKYAKEYAYVMELPSMASDDDVEFETNADTISDDDGFDNDNGGLKVDGAVDA